MAAPVDSAPCSGASKASDHRSLGGLLAGSMRAKELGGTVVKAPVPDFCFVETRCLCKKESLQTDKRTAQLSRGEKGGKRNGEKKQGSNGGRSAQMKDPGKHIKTKERST